MATRDEVARRAGVSSSTVSYVISGQRPISAATRERVHQAMRDLDYTPNAFARGLAGSRRGLVALHYPPTTHGLSSSSFEYISAAAERSRDRGYHLLLWTNPIDDAAGLHSLVGQQLVDGVILMEVRPEDPRIAVLQASGTPFVTVGRPADIEGVAYVDDDFDSLADQTIDHLADLGHRRVMLLTSAHTVRVIRAMEVRARQRGVQLALAHNEDSVRGGREAFARLRAMDPAPTAVATASETALLGLYHAAALAGVRIPDDLSVVGLAVGTVGAEMLLPELTTVSPPSTRMSTTAVDVLADMIEGKVADVPQSLLAPTLMVRASSAPPA